MKLRLQSNSIRLRLKRKEVEQLAATGRVEEQIAFGPKRDDVLRYVLETSVTISVPQAHYQDRLIIVQVPKSTLTHWASSDQVGIEAAQALGEQGELHVLIEKDFACLNGPEEQNIDTFPNPLAGTKC